MKIWKFYAKKMLSVDLIFNSVLVEMYWHQILTSSFPCQLKITVAVEPYDGLGDIQLKVGLIDAPSV